MLNLSGGLNYTKVFTPSVVAEFKFGFNGWYEHSGAESEPDY